MKTTILLLAWMISTVASAQVIDFSGTWNLNTSKSKLNEQFSMAPKTLIITQKDNELTVERHSSFQDQNFITNDLFTLDGKECINKGWQDMQKKSAAVWSDDKQSLKITSRIVMNDGGEITITEVFKKEGDNFIIESGASSSFGDMSETMVYDK